MKLSKLSDEVMLEITILLDKDNISYTIEAESGGDQMVSFEDEDISKISPATKEYLISLGINFAA